MWWSTIRNYLYDRNYLTSVRASGFVLSVGNLTWGGTGKTTITHQICSYFLKEGCKVAIISRGYGRASRGLQLVSDGTRILLDWHQAGDEPYLLAKKNQSAIVICAEDRTAAFDFLRSASPDVILLDDAFQHRRAHRDLDLVLIDGSEDITRQRVIPFGKLRESLDSLQRAGAVIVTHANRIDPNTREWIQDQIRVAVFRANYKPVTTGLIQDKKVAAFCAIGAPQHFFELLKQTAAELVFATQFRDHYVYRASDLARIEAKARRHGADVIATTEKDFIKLKTEWCQMPVVAVEAMLEIDPEQEFYSLLKSQISCVSS